MDSEPQPTEQGLRLHVIPIGDEQIHAGQECCWCHPTEIEGVWVHNAKDCREAKERQSGCQESAGWVMIAEYFPTTSS